MTSKCPPPQQQQQLSPFYDLSALPLVKRRGGMRKQKSFSLSLAAASASVTYRVNGDETFACLPQKKQLLWWHSARFKLCCCLGTFVRPFQRRFMKECFQDFLKIKSTFSSSVFIRTLRCYHCWRKFGRYRKAGNGHRH